MKILIAGDFCPIGRTDKYLKEEKYDQLFNGYNRITNQVDYSVVNFECPVTNSNIRIDKTGPCIKTDNINSLIALKYIGFDMLTLANNHIQDYSNQGVLDTLAHAREYKFDVVGAGKDINEASKPLIKEIDGVKVGFVNISENEFCAVTNDRAGAYTFNLIDNLSQIKELRLKVDKLILIYHGGREHYQLPTPKQRKRFRFFIENGVDAIVAHHTHCFSGFEYYRGKPIVYSLGNFIFDYKKKYQKGMWTEGMSVILSLKDENFKVKFIPHFQGREEDSTLKILEGDVKDAFIKRIESLSLVIKSDNLFKEEWNKYLETQEAFYLSSIYVKNIYLRFLFMKGLLPKKWLKSKHNRLLLNLMRCESHHEISKEVLNNEIIN